MKNIKNPARYLPIIASRIKNPIDYNLETRKSNYKLVSNYINRTRKSKHVHGKIVENRLKNAERLQAEIEKLMEKSENHYTTPIHPQQRQKTITTPTMYTNNSPANILSENTFNNELSASYISSATPSSSSAQTLQIPSLTSLMSSTLRLSTPSTLSTLSKSSPQPTSVEWYRIPEIAFTDFVKCCKPLYSVLQKPTQSNNHQDPFLKNVIIGYNNMSEDEWNTHEKARLLQKALENKIGDFHEEIMGKFPGYVTYPNGHTTGCDVGSTDGKVLFEVKNRDNTMNSSSGEATIAKLKRHADNGIRAILVEINCPGGKVNRYKAPPSIEVWNGQQAYTFLSGRSTFFNDLNSTLQHVFQNYKAYADLEKTVA
jgi:hypothetical protein